MFNYNDNTLRSMINYINQLNNLVDIARTQLLFNNSIEELEHIEYLSHRFYEEWRRAMVPNRHQQEVKALAVIGAVKPRRNGQRTLGIQKYLNIMKLKPFLSNMSDTTTQQLDILDQVYLITDDLISIFLGHTDDSIYEILDIFSDNAIITGKNPYTPYFSQVKLNQLRLYKKFECDNSYTQKEVYEKIIKMMEIVSEEIDNWSSDYIYVGPKIY